MFINIDQTSNVPLYNQIVNQIKLKIASGELKEGDQLPSVRSLAAILVINPNTIQKVYRELSNESVIYSRKGQGVFVAKIKNVLKERVRKEKVNEKLNAFISEAKLLGYTKEQIIKMFDSKLKEFHVEDEF